MSSQDWNEQMQLNDSRFLIEELNLEQEPTQQEILERAEELEIDDLVLAKQSLTKELDPEWKPYCNRYSKIYYVNLMERLAYLDHPIDMYYKQEYAKLNGLPIPRFQSFKIEDISQSLELIEEEIKKFQRSHKTTLRIVYQQPSQEQALSSYQKSPINNRSDFDNESQIQLQQLGLNEVQSLHLYQKQLEQKYYQQYLKKKKELRTKQIAKEEEHENTMKFILETKIQQICEAYQDELTRKNKISLKKQEQKMQSQYQQRRMEYCQNIEKFNKNFDKLREKQRNIETLYQNKNASQRTMTIGNIKLKADYEKLKAISTAQEKMKREFGQKMVSLYSNSPAFQEAMSKPFDQFQAQPQFRKDIRKIMEKPRKPLFENKSTDIRKIETDMEYLQLKKQIKELTLWENEDISSSWSIGNRGSYNPTNLSLKLRMRVI